MTCVKCSPGFPLIFRSFSLQISTGKYSLNRMIFLDGFFLLFFEPFLIVKQVFKIFLELRVFMISHPVMFLVRQVNLLRVRVIERRIAGHKCTRWLYSFIGKLALVLQVFSLFHTYIYIHILYQFNNLSLIKISTNCFWKIFKMNHDTQFKPLSLRN